MFYNSLRRDVAFSGVRRTLPGKPAVAPGASITIPAICRRTTSRSPTHTTAEDGRTYVNTLSFATAFQRFEFSDGNFGRILSRIGAEGSVRGRVGAGLKTTAFSG